MVNALLAKELYILDHLTDMQSNNYVIGKFSKVSNNKKRRKFSNNNALTFAIKKVECCKMMAKCLKEVTKGLKG